MAKKAPKVDRPGGDAARPARRPGKAKVTMWLDEELARKLRALRGWEGRELGDIAGPILEQGLSSWYIAQRAGRAAARPGDPAVRIAASPEPPGDVAGEGEEAA